MTPPSAAAQVPAQRLSRPWVPLHLSMLFPLVSSPPALRPVALPTCSPFSSTCLPQLCCSLRASVRSGCCPSQAADLQKLLWVVGRMLALEPLRPRFKL